MKKPRLRKSGERAGRSKKQAADGPRSAKQVLLLPVDGVKAVIGGVGVVANAIASPFRRGAKARRDRKAKKASKAEALAALRFSRMAPRLQKDVTRTRRRLFD